MTKVCLVIEVSGTIYSTFKSIYVKQKIKKKYDPDVI